MHSKTADNRHDASLQATNAEPRPRVVALLDVTQALSSTLQPVKDNVLPTVLVSQTSEEHSVLKQYEDLARENDVNFERISVSGKQEPQDVVSFMLKYL
jgi:hypothetical protein